jgi:hypothetical protein
MKKPIVVTGIVGSYLLSTDHGAPEYCGAHEIPDVAIDNGDQLLTLDYLLPLEGRWVTVTIQVLDGPPAGEKTATLCIGESESWGTSITHSRGTSTVRGKHEGKS